jgi:hypothetical protein
MANGLKNIPLRVFREYLQWKGLKKIRTNGGHEIWSGAKYTRPITIQTHVDPVPEFIVKNNLRTLGVGAEDFHEFMRTVF